MIIQTSLFSTTTLYVNAKEGGAYYVFLFKPESLRPLEIVTLIQNALENDNLILQESFVTLQDSSWILLIQTCNQTEYFASQGVPIGEEAIANGQGITLTLVSPNVIVTITLNAVSQTINTINPNSFNIAAKAAGTLNVVAFTTIYGWNILASGTTNDGYHAVANNSSLSFTSGAPNKTWRLDGAIVATNTNSYTVPAQSHNTYHSISASTA